jgi:hypothetical protein
MTAYTWTYLGGANIPAADGVACCVHPNGNMFMFGGIYTGVNNELRIAHESTPANWTNLGSQAAPARHLANLIPHSDGRIYIRGGCHVSVPPQKDLWSFAADGTDMRLEDGDCAPGPRIGVLNFSIGDYIYEVGGQNQILASPAPLPPLVYYTDFWRWSVADGWEVLFADDTWGAPDENPVKRMTFGTRGFYSGGAVFDGQKVYLVGGAEYENVNWPRDTKHDLYTLEIDGAGLPVVTLVNARLPWRGCMWQTLFIWENNLWAMLGHDLALGGGANGDLTSVWRSPDGGVTWIAMPAFPGTKRHAAASFVTPGGVIIGTGSHYGNDLWKMFIDIYTNGAPPNGTAGPGNFYTFIDRVIPVPANTLINTISVSFAYPHTGMKTKVTREVSAGVHDIVWDQPFDHPGGGHFDLPCGFTTPNDGATYRVGFYGYLPGSPPETFGNGAYPRAQMVGDAVGNGVILSPQSDGSFCMRYS